ncbi:MAG: GatB/YqeY domain-containing protein [Actinobacteria bacterium]|nr:MAG: GatB/YqeY domain-containing protein [Actinomycetota bacterium]
MSLKEEIRKDLTEAMKAKKSLKVSTLRLLIAGITNSEKEKGQDLSDEQVLEVVVKEAKKRSESIEEYKKAGRNELADKESQEKEILQKYLSAQLSDEEIKKIVKDTITESAATDKKDIGKVMSLVMPQVKGKADGRRVNQIVNKML